MAKGLRSKSRRRNEALKRQKLQKTVDARFERLSQVLQETTGVGPDTMDTLQLAEPKPKAEKRKARIVVRDTAAPEDPMEGVISGRVEKPKSKREKRRERSKSLVRKLK